MRISKILVFCLFIFPNLSQAAPDYDAANKLVKDTYDKFTDSIKEKKKQIDNDPTIAVKLAEGIVLPHFNIERMSKRVLARNWLSAKADQKQRFMQEFKWLMIRTYARTIVEYVEEKIEFLPYKIGKKENRVTIRLRVSPAAAKAIPIHFVMAFKDGEWKAIDVKIDSVSLVRNYRSTFARDIRKGGLDKLLEKLAAKNKEKQGS